MCAGYLQLRQPRHHRGGANAIERLFLIGPPGAGKSTIGRRLAKLRNLDFVDSDDEIEQRCGVDIGFIFEKEGEDGFREREQRIIDELSQRNRVVLATGGGAVMREANRQLLAARGQVIYLRATVDQQLRRTQHSSKRPLLNTSNRRATLEQMFAVRDPLYTGIADVVLETQGRQAKTVANELNQLLDNSTP